MKLVYAICILLTVTISSIASDNAGATQPANEQAAGLTDSTAAFGKTSSPIIAVEAPVTNINTNGNNIASNANATNNGNANTTIDGNANATIDDTKTTVVPTTADVTTKPTNTTLTTVAMPTSTHKSNTDKTTELSSSTVTKPTVPTTATSASVTNVTNANRTTITTTVTTTTTTTNTSTTNEIVSSPVSETTAIPMSTKVVPPYIERRFDRLSFVGGIILATCLIAIGALSWKFYKPSPRLNYRTL